MSICAQVRKILTGAYNEGDPPLSIPNREVKPLRADGTAAMWESLRADGTAAMWESRSAPDLGSPAGSKPRGFFCLSRGGLSRTFVVLFESFSFRVL